MSSCDRDQLDSLSFIDHHEDPRRYEEALAELIAESGADREVDAFLHSIAMHPDRRQVFSAFDQSGVPDAIVRTMQPFGINEASAICDVGCGPGFLAWALLKRGFHRVSAMDPSSEWISGTGYLRKIAGEHIEIINDLKAWEEGGRDFEAVVTRSTVHHWQHIPQASLLLRRNLRDDGLWFCNHEFVANTPLQLKDMLESHLSWARLKIYEWPYPASAYVDLISYTGFRLIAVVPQFFGGNTLSGSDPELPDFDMEAFDREVGRDLVERPSKTVDEFWREVDHFRTHRHGNRLFTLPQLFVFQKTEPY